jgi:hypothetical protein
MVFQQSLARRLHSLSCSQLGSAQCEGTRLRGFEEPDFDFSAFDKDEENSASPYRTHCPCRATNGEKIN